MQPEYLLAKVFEKEYIWARETLKASIPDLWHFDTDPNADPDPQIFTFD